ncbi:glutamate 5-kinase [Kangiella sediminilitoris]|uniref:Glutamate 5-kinase n=1 Tax=Kangiella sediminilitoris TaxID=1144748 RepID=A0A1B3BA65_9GAMM|nr:glutamate 5-kinase [Kangiella sediminilitoris]AOE49712.1 Glutamate 5-kinase [Kangiella sediminilitoris]
MNEFDFTKYKNIVVKVGSALIAPDGHSCSARYCLPIANFIKKCQELGKTITLVSSGAVAAGYNTLRPSEEDLSTVERQALAAIGQSKVINHWQQFFDQPVAQVLLTAADIQNPTRSVNAKKTISTLHQHRVIPIVNENDTVAIEELMIGDNDNLAAKVAALTGADLLIICSDVDGLFTENPHLAPEAKLLHRVENITPDIMQMGKCSHNPQARGGMQTKLEAALIADNHGIDTIICNGRKEAYCRLLSNNNAGTWIGINNQFDSVTTR